MDVSDILKDKGSDVVALAADDSVADAVALLANHYIGSVVVRDTSGGIAGIVSERDVVRSLHEHGAAVLGKTVGELMTTDVVTCGKHDPIAGIMAMMTAHRFRHVPVVEDGKLAGIISIGDVVRSRIEEAQAEVDALRQYILT